MKKILVIAIFFLSACSGSHVPLERPADPIVGEINIIPQPNSIKRIGGQFELNPETKIIAADQSGVQAAAVLNEVLQRNYGFTLDLAEQDNISNSIKFLAATPADGLGQESYFLRVQPGSIQIIGYDPGLFYGIQTLSQLLPIEFDGKAMIPAVEILDTPRFSYRGMHLDVSRHFMPVEFVKKFIGIIARYKYNYFHWHLTDDQGWRIEIRKYPRLTEIGSKRIESMVGKDEAPYIGDHIPVEGYYTQEQIQEIVAFARTKYITIIPEIDMPGHSAAAVASYPELGCRNRYPAGVPTTWKASTNVLCPKEQTFQFIKNVIAEVAELFPDSPYIHIGGDEVKTDQWRESPVVAALMKQNNLRNDIEVRSWFMQRVADLVRAQGKKAIGWDELIAGVPPRDTTIMSWRGDTGGVAAARAGLPVIMSPYNFTYFDRLQGDQASEPLSILPVISMEKVYRFEPVPATLSAAQSRHVIGAQACLWTEFIKDPGHLEYMAFPRALALAEVLWSNPENRNYANFTKRLFKELPWLDRENVNYRLPTPLGFRDREFSVDEEALVDLTSPVRGGKIYYTIDGTTPNPDSNLYEQPFILSLAPNQEIVLKVKIIAGVNRESAVFTAKYFRESVPTVSSSRSLLSHRDDHYPR